MNKLARLFALLPLLTGSSFAQAAETKSQPQTYPQLESLDANPEDRKKPPATGENPVGSESNRYTTDAGASVNTSSNATALPGLETNTSFNFQSSSSYERGDDPIHRGTEPQHGTPEDTKESANLMNEDSRSLSGGVSGSAGGESLQSTTRTLQGSELIANIQTALQNNINLSESAHRIKVTSQNGQIYLRGLVENPAEKAEVEKIAKKISGNNLVINQVDVKNR